MTSPFSRSRVLAFSRSRVLAYLIVVCALASTGRAQISQGQAREALLRAYPGLEIREQNGRVRQVYGMPMTTRQTAREAVGAWLEQYGAALTGRTLGIREYSKVRLKSGKTVLRYQQWFEGVQVVGTMVTAVTMGEGPQTLVYVGVLLGDAPEGPLPVPAVTAARALQVAQAHPSARGLSEWRTPEKILRFVENGEGGAPCSLVWRCVGSGGTESYDSRTFYIDPVSGAVVREFSNGVSLDVTGSVIAYLTPGLRPDPWGNNIAQPPTGTIGCPNSVQAGFPLRQIRVVAKNHSTGVPLAEAFTDDDGDFVVPLAGGLTVDLEVSLVGQHWRVWDHFGPSAFPGVPAPPETLTNISSTATLTQPITFNIPDGFPVAVPPSADEQQRTGHVNGFYQTELTWRYFSDRIYTDNVIPGLHDTVTLIMNSRERTGNAKAYVNEKHLEFGHATLNYANAGYSTWIAHEYAHYLLAYMTGIHPTEPDWRHLSFHEGFADSVAHLSNLDTNGKPPTVWGADWLGCGLPARTPLLPSRRSYPHCSEAEEHEVGTILSGIWLDLFSELEAAYGTATALTTVRQLHVDWTFLTNGGESNDVACNPPPSGPDAGRSVTCGTMTEVLTADDNDGDLSNGTPHDDQIIDAFALHGFPSAICGGDRAYPVSGAPLDCNRDHAINLQDVMCYHARYAAGDRRADCDQNGLLSADDLACFMERYRAEPAQ
ncbi:MAG: hypothetical protein IT437_03930 [Phycisphaerales bacterium]|nr:hypothetical protein [Phycisphaerales bacterium]